MRISDWSSDVCSSDLIEKLNALLEQRGHSHDKTSYSQFVEHDFAFHSGVVHASHNRALAETYLFFSASVHEVIKATLNNEIPEPDFDEHRGIVRAIQSRHPDLPAATPTPFLPPSLPHLHHSLPTSIFTPP